MNISCWIRDKKDFQLVSRLLSRGFTAGFIANWLCFDMKTKSMDCSHYKFLDGVSFRVIQAEETEEIWKECEEGHPCYKDSIWKTRQMHQAATLSNGKLVMFIGYLNEVPIASATLYLGQGELFGVAGLYEVEVVRSKRGKGIGKAISYATCYYANLLGYRYVLGNASNEGVPMYLKIGFEEFGFGQVYFYSESLLDNPVDKKELEFIEAIESKDYSTLSSLAKDFKNKSKLTCGLSAIQLAIFLQLQDVALWLHNKEKFILDIMSAHELGWGDEISLLVSFFIKNAYFLLQKLIFFSYLLFRFKRIEIYCLGEEENMD